MVTDSIGKDGFEAVQDAGKAFDDLGKAASSWSAGNDAKAWDQVGDAGHQATGAVVNAVTQAGKDAINGAIDGAVSTAVAAVQSVPGANAVVDAATMAFGGYEVGKDISGIASDFSNHNFQQAGEDVVSMANGEQPQPQLPPISVFSLAITSLTNRLRELCH